MDARTIYRHVAAVARRAGVAHVHPHALRHTLATQCKPSTVAFDASFDWVEYRATVRGAALRCAA
jgi:integrase